MYKYLLLAILAVSIAITGCGDDDFQVLVGNQLSYDGPNNSSPIFPAGEYAAAAHFPLANIEEAVGRDIVSLEFYVYDVPALYSYAVIYEAEATNNIPGREIYAAEITGELTANAWNVHTLDVPITITDKGFWASFEFSTDAAEQTIGCDAGQAEPNGDWILFNTDNRFLTFRNRTNNATDVNWNIKVNLSN